jgi:Ca-activated chloride channel family protein
LSARVADLLRRPESFVFCVGQKAAWTCDLAHVFTRTGKSRFRGLFRAAKIERGSRAWKRAMTPHRWGSLVPLFVSVAACAHHKHPAKAPVPNSANQAAMALAADPKLIEMTTEATTTLVNASATSQLGVRIQIRALDLPAGRRPPLNLGLVLDTSGSMEGDSIVAVRDSARKLIAKLRDGDRISVVAFHSRVDVLVSNTVVNAATRKSLDAAIAKIQAKGTTDLAAGLATGLQLVRAGQFPQGINRIVLLSDGVPNTNATLPALITTAHHYGIAMTTLGLGIDYDTALMTQMARDTGGTFHYLDKPEAVATVFDDELTRMSTVVGRNLQLVLEPGPGVTIEPMAGLVLGGDGKVYATIGDLPAGEKRDLMIPIKVAARGEGSTAELVQATLMFDDVIGQSGRKQRDGFVSVKTSKDTVAVKRAVKIDLEVARVRTSAASAILEAITLARQGQLDQARKRLANATELVRAASTRLQDPELAKIISQLEEVTKQLAQLVAQQEVISAQPPTIGEQMQNSPSVDKKPTAPKSTRPPAVAPEAVERKLRKIEEQATKSVSGS